MTNTAKILNFGRGNFAGQERNVADLDDGYARLSTMLLEACLLYTSPSPRDTERSRMPSSA
ncbi:hypothetical protein JMUB7551_28620 [Staphylococcus aureus]